MKLLYTTREARDAIGCGTTRLYEHINAGRLEARRIGRRTYITSDSLHALVASMERVVTPKMKRAEAARAAAAEAEAAPEQTARK